MLTFLLCYCSAYAKNQPKTKATITNLNGSFKWDVLTDNAILTNVLTEKQFWTGSLLPAFWIQQPGGEKLYLKASVDMDKSMITSHSGVLRLKFGQWGNGLLHYSVQNAGFIIDSLHVKWHTRIPAIIDLYFGTNPLTDGQKAVVTNADANFWPAWQAEGYCVPSAKGSPVISFFRAHVLGDVEMPLGSFGTSGTPYAAAYPRPTYAAAMGGNHGWVALGTGAIPQSAMYLEIKATCGAFRYRYREDLWGAGTSSRSWTRPLVMSWDITAWDAFNSLFACIDTSKAVDAIHQRSHWNTWGDFSKGEYDLRDITQSAKNMHAEELTLDMGWETSESTGQPNFSHLPDFYNDVDHIKRNGLQVGFWQSLIWIRDTSACGLGKADLLTGLNGQLCKSNIFHNPYWESGSYFCIDPSSPKAREFLRSRTRNILKTTGASLLKLDFAYALLPPDAAAPRDPTYRGENYAVSLIKIIAGEARKVNPDITIQYYGISPLLKPVYNLLALDDMADASGDEAAGHAQWSIWASLAGERGQAIMASSGYNWKSDAEILLNTCIVGSPGSVLNRLMPDGSAVPGRYAGKRKALNLWYRRSTGWEPLWLNSFKGDLDREPYLMCWGRLEKIRGKNELTSLALRDPYQLLTNDAMLSNAMWKGRWAIISQDQANIFSTKKLAIIPFDKGQLVLPFKNRPQVVQATFLKKEAIYENWKWHNGFLVINVTSDKLLDDLVGFTVTTP